MTTIEIQRALLDLVQDLRRLDLRLTRLASGVENPLFSAETDEPLNLEGAILGLITSTQEDELATIIQILNRVATLTSEDLEPEALTEAEQKPKTDDRLVTTTARRGSDV